MYITVIWEDKETNSDKGLLGSGMYWLVPRLFQDLNVRPQKQLSRSETRTLAKGIINRIPVQ